MVRKPVKRQPPGNHLAWSAFTDRFGDILVEGFLRLALFAIGAVTVWSAAQAFFGMAAQGGASIKDILLLFIYLELGAMVGIYFKTRHLPVRYLIYIAITALTRHLLDYVIEDHKPDTDILIVAGGILVLSIAVLALRYGSYKFPSPAVEEDDGVPEETPRRGTARK